MLAVQQPLAALTAEDVMRREVKTIPHDMPVRDAARMLVHEQISGAPVVDDAGRCIGVLSATDFVRWAKEEGRDNKDFGLPVCAYQVKGRLLTGEDAVICTLAEGRCPLQMVRPTTAGRHTVICRQPEGVLCDWQQVAQQIPVSPASRYMTADVVTGAPTETIAGLARLMLDAHIHRIVVVDNQRHPIGIVSSTDILAAVAYSAAESVH